LPSLTLRFLQEIYDFTFPRPVISLGVAAGTVAAILAVLVAFARDTYTCLRRSGNRGMPDATYLSRAGAGVARLAPLAGWSTLCLGVWMVMFAGPRSKVVGGFISSLPFSKSLHHHRFIAGVQGFGLIQIGILVDMIIVIVAATTIPTSVPAPVTKTAKTTKTAKPDGKVKRGANKKGGGVKSNVASTSSTATKNTTADMTATTATVQVVGPAQLAVLIATLAAVAHWASPNVGRRIAIMADADVLMKTQFAKFRSGDNDRSHALLVKDLDRAGARTGGRVFTGFMGYPWNTVEDYEYVYDQGDRGYRYCSEYGWKTNTAFLCCCALLILSPPTNPFPRLYRYAQLQEEGYDMIAGNFHTMAPASHFMECTDTVRILYCCCTAVLQYSCTSLHRTQVAPRFVLWLSHTRGFTGWSHAPPVSVF
jgi:hypothetical protein